MNIDPRSLRGAGPSQGSDQPQRPLPQVPGNSSITAWLGGTSGDSGEPRGCRNLGAVCLLGREREEADPSGGRPGRGGAPESAHPRKELRPLIASPATSPLESEARPDFQEQRGAPGPPRVSGKQASAREQPVAARIRGHAGRWSAPASLPRRPPLPQQLALQAERDAVVESAARGASFTLVAQQITASTPLSDAKRAEMDAGSSRSALTGPLRDARTTSCLASSALATAAPMAPVAPMTMIFMAGPWRENRRARKRPAFALPSPRA